MATRIISLALALCFLLSACGGKEEPSRGRASLLAQAAELEEEETLLVIGGREVPAWRYLYWLGWVCDRLQRQYDLAEISLDWGAAVTGGTLEEYARDRALADTALYATVENWAEEYGVSLEESGTKTTLPEEGLTEAQMAELEEVGGLYAALYDLFCTEGSPLAPTEEVLRTFAETQGWLTVEQLLVPYGEDREEARQQAEELFARFNGAEDQAAEFSVLTENAPPGTLQLGDGTLEPTLESAAAVLEVGQCSGILESAEGFVILRRVETDTELLKEACFDYLLQQSAEASLVEVTEAYRELSVAEFHQRLLQLREEEKG